MHGWWILAAARQAPQAPHACSARAARRPAQSLQSRAYGCATPSAEALLWRTAALLPRAKVGERATLLSRAMLEMRQAGTCSSYSCSSSSLGSYA